MNQTLYRVSYKWMDIADSNTGFEIYETLQEANDARAKLIADQQNWISSSPDSAGKLQIVIDSFSFAQQISCDLV